jgi:hypothetical protein
MFSAHFRLHCNRDEFIDSQGAATVSEMGIFQ